MMDDMAEAKRIAAGLSEDQRAALARLSPSHMQTARRLRISKNTLRALLFRGLVIGHNDFMWRLSDDGHAALLADPSTGERAV